MFRITFCSVFLLVLTLGCSQEPTGSIDKAPPIQLGTPIGDTDVQPAVTELLWARDGSEIYYYAIDTYPYSSLKAVRVDDGSTRMIDPRVRSPARHLLLGSRSTVLRGSDHA